MVLPEWSPAALADALRGMSDESDWWAAHLFERDYRDQDNWLVAHAAAIDLDYHLDGKHVLIPDDHRAFIEQFIDDAPGTLFHFTPRGLRFIFLFDAPCTDADLWQRAARGAAAEVVSWANKAGVADGKAWSLDVDEGASFDHARLFWGPRGFDVIVLRDYPCAAGDLAAVAPVERVIAPTTPRAEVPAGRQHEPYVQRALDAEVAAVVRLGEGERNAGLNRAAFNLGTLVGAGVLDSGEVEASLLAACRANGLVGDDGERATLASLRSGLEAGMKEPRELPERAPPEGLPTDVRNPGAYARAAVAKAADAVRAKTVGLEEAARSTARFVTGGWIAREAVESALQLAGEDTGAAAAEVRKAVASGLGDARGPVMEPGSATPAAAVDASNAVLPTADHQHVAATFLDARGRDGEGRALLRRWRGDWLRWKRGAYRAIEEERVEAELWQHLGGLWVPGKEGPVPYSPNVSKVTNVKKALAAIPGVLLDADLEPPCWIGEGTRQVGRDIVVCANGVLDLPTGALAPLSPDLFATSALDVEWNAEAQTPTEWLHFLHDLWPEDDDAIQLLQEWFGYCLAADTSQHKMLWLIGPRRSGKGTIMKVLTELVGRANIAAPTLSSLSGSFGLQPLLGKTLAIIGDARLSARADQAVIVEHLLALVGEDPIEVNRKNKATVTAAPSARIVLVSNELPRLQDTALALAGRVLLLNMTRSFYGNEDVGLAERLLEELPGILSWAVNGWRRLRARGRFVMPEASRDMLDSFTELSSPIESFLADCCDVGDAAAWVAKDRLYNLYRQWSEAQGTRPKGKAVMVRDIKAVRPEVQSVRLRDTDGNRFYALTCLDAKGLATVDIET